MFLMLILKIVKRLFHIIGCLNIQMQQMLVLEEHLIFIKRKCKINNLLIIKLFYKSINTQKLIFVTNTIHSI